MLISPQEQNPQFENALIGLAHIHTIRINTQTPSKWIEAQQQMTSEGLFARLSSLQVVVFDKSPIEWRRRGSDITTVSRECDYSWLDWTESMHDLDG